MIWDKAKQLRHAAQYCFRFRSDGQRKDILRLERELDLLGYNGMVASMSPAAIIQGWREAGWVNISPNGWELRLSEAGNEQLAQWDEEDTLWAEGAKSELKLAKRLKAGEPVTNLRKIAQVIGSSMLTCVHDPYINEAALQTLHKLGGIGVGVSTKLRLLTAPKTRIAATSIASFLCDLNVEMSSQWELRAYTSRTKPHRRFLVLADKSIITCGLSLNNIDKDEVLDRIPMGDERADYDSTYFDNCWLTAKKV